MPSAPASPLGYARDSDQQETRVSETLPEDLVALMRQASPCFISTAMPDGSPQLTQTWVDTDGVRILVNTVEGFQKVRNIRRDPRVAVAVSDPSNPSRYYSIRGEVLSITSAGAAEHIEQLAQRYLGTPYPWYGGRDQIRLIVTIDPHKIHHMG
jgi:PPOX class probable F420-dependent enzyme